MERIGVRYQQLVQQMHGQIADICSNDWGGVIDQLAADAFRPQLDFPLTEASQGATITVSVNGVPVPETDPVSGQVHWHFDPTVGNYGGVVFDPADGPNPGDTVSIDYPVPCAP